MFVCKIFLEIFKRNIFHFFRLVVLTKFGQGRQEEFALRGFWGSKRDLFPVMMHSLNSEKKHWCAQQEKTAAPWSADDIAQCSYFVTNLNHVCYFQSCADDAFLTIAAGLVYAETIVVLPK